jgi:hypothetical protein
MKPLYSTGSTTFSAGAAGVSRPNNELKNDIGGHPRCLLGP